MMQETVKKINWQDNQQQVPKEECLKEEQKWSKKKKKKESPNVSLPSSWTKEADLLIDTVRYK